MLVNGQKRDSCIKQSQRLRVKQFITEVGFEVLTAVITSETLVNFYQTSRRYNPEDSRLVTEVITKIFVLVEHGFGEFSTS
jgi:hypothetical protein